VRYVVGIGTAGARRAVDALMTAGGSSVRPASTRDFDVRLAPGCVVLAGAVLAMNIGLGRHTHLHRCATVGHDSELGDYVTVNPSASVSGDCVVEDDVMIGVGAAVLQGLRVARSTAVAPAWCATCRPAWWSRAYPAR
jgi:UDP-3-O-[3-hydroxymyristoyl] glucosamine N-acyltransferase